MSARKPSFSSARRFAIAALLGTTFLAGPLAAAHANPTVGAPVQLAQNGPAKTADARRAAKFKPETVEHRIAVLRADLKITPAQEADWQAVAQVMRDNAANMERLITAKRAQVKGSMTALQDLDTYQDFAQARVDGLNKLVPAFTKLYNSMPDAQKKNADAVFNNFGRPKHVRAHR